jgi:1,4-dihydroxy-2-naphthoyl-CoA hydrolase
MTCEIGQRDRVQIRTVQSTIAGHYVPHGQLCSRLYPWHFAEEKRPAAQAFATPPGRGWDVMMVDRETSGDDWPQTIPFEQTFDGLYGLEILELGEVRATGTVRVRDAVRQPIGLVHGGVYASISEALTSLATGAGVSSEGLIATGMSNHTNFLRPITDGVIHAEAVRRHRGRTSWMWDVAITDDEGRLCAVSRMTIAVRPPHR